MDEKEIQYKNYEAELIGLRTECIEKASELSSILKSIDSIKNEIEDLELKKIEIQRYCDKIRSELTEENVRIISEKTNLMTLKETSTKELKQLQNDIKTANRELGWSNDKVFKAQEEFNSIEKEKIDAQNKILEMNLLLKQIPILEREIQDLEEKRNLVRSDTSDMLAKSTNELQQAKEILQKLQESVAKKVEEANTAEYRLKKYTDELFTHMNDYEVVRSRLENIWNKTFPELELKI